MSAASSLVTRSLDRAMSGMALAGVSSGGMSSGGSASGSTFSGVSREAAVNHARDALAIEGLGAGLQNSTPPDAKAHSGPTGTGTAHHLPQLGSLRVPKPE